ncbi:MAG: SurA N-terminal domain-containing protein [Thiogranum sp.]
MLQAMRDRAMGVLGWIVIGLIIITFALFGLGSYLQDKSQVFVAKVNDVEISPRQLQVAYQQQRARMEQMLGDAYNPALIDDQRLKQTALNGLIQRQLLLQAAQNDGMLVSDQLLAAKIHAVPAFQQDGSFSEQLYQTLIRQQGRLPAEFEYETRRMLQTEQLVNGLSQTAFVTRDEVDRAYRLQEQQRDFSYLIVSSESFKKNVEISDEQIKQYYDQHSEKFVTPERVRLAYLRLTGDALSESIQVDEEELLADYEEKKESLLTQEQRQASHILIQHAAGADEETTNKAKAEAEDLLQQIRSGGDFAELARQHSDDPGSAAQGGDLGFFARGAMVPEFEETVFSMEVGDVSEVVHTQFGFHIIKLTEVRGAEIPALEEVREELVAGLKQRDLSDLFYEQFEQLSDVSYENPDSLDAAADALGLEVQTSDWLAATGGTGIGEYPKVVAIAFSEDVLEAGNNSEPIEVGDKDVIVVRVEDRQVAQATPLDTVREQIIEELRQQQAVELAMAKGEELVQQLEQGGLMEDLSGPDYITSHKADGVTRAKAEEHNADVVREVFRLSRPQGDESVYKGFKLGNGDYAVVHLAGVSDADPAAMEEATRSQLERGLENMRRSVVVSALTEDLRARADILIPKDEESE